MSVYDGMGKGARQRRRDERYYRAVGRQLPADDHHQLTRHGNTLVPYASVELFLRREHRGLVADPGIDFRSYARETRRG
ncbi:MAG TPA: hypothetical protein VFC19_49405 [Candidatus Limnocylindrales bacterium]|nr:hypothetical protein [Candidatus Limnocylindrales bacterium]